MPTQRWLAARFLTRPRWPGRVMEIFVVSGAIYLTITFLHSLVISAVERLLNAHQTHRRG